MWTNIEQYKIATTKIHCKLKRKLSSKCYCSGKHLRTYRNFCINKLKVFQRNFTFVIFESGFVNICGIKTEEDINDSLLYLLKVTNRKRLHLNNFTDLDGSKKIIVDNITVTGTLKSELNIDFFLLDKTIKASLNNTYKSNFNCLHFPGLFLSIRHRPGKIVLFRNGKFNLLGLKCHKDILDTLSELDAFINHISMMLMKE